MNLELWMEGLRETLGGKDPRRTKKPVRGSIVLLLRDASGALSRATIRVETDAVTVHSGNVAPSGEPRIVVRGAIDDWLAYVMEQSGEAAARLEMYGDAGPMKTLSEVLALSRNTAGVRFGKFQ